ncbi:hypothetical protein HJC23_006867 [Cyclotella cryptica]|uniref:Fungal lipase-type domain-containing protein n=1 Tax=Cyclotella cryptica TaxID=29204 RepID=A0ABD3QBT1_9STRA
MVLGVGVILAFLLIKSTKSASVRGPNSRRLSAKPSGMTEFPSSEIVLDMVILSNAVYHMLNKVVSCNDTQASNQTIVSSTRQELRSALTSDDFDQLVTMNDKVKQKHLRRLADDTPEQKNLFDVLLPEGVTCLHYSHDHDLGTQVLIVRSSIHNYVTVVYAGTDDFQTALMDGDILMGSFGSSSTTTTNNTNSTEPSTKRMDEMDKLFEEVPQEVRVHRGFNSAVFDNDGFLNVLRCVTSARLDGSCDDAGAEDTQMDTTMLSGFTPYQLYTTGHSLGAADSVLLGAALHLAFPQENIQSINFGCPKIGNVEWSYWIDSLQLGTSTGHDNSSRVGSFEVFRFVNKIDLVPRLPELLFQHAGHTLQMSIGGVIRAYYNHWGDGDLGYAGVPFGWGEEPYIFLPGALMSHNHRRYVEYLQNYVPKSNSSSARNETLYFVREFERIEENGTTATVAPISAAM